MKSHLFISINIGRIPIAGILSNVFLRFSTRFNVKVSYVNVVKLMTL